MAPQLRDDVGGDDGARLLEVGEVRPRGARGTWRLVAGALAGAGALMGAAYLSRSGGSGGAALAMVSATQNKAQEVKALRASSGHQGRPEHGPSAGAQERYKTSCGETLEMLRGAHQTLPRDLPMHATAGDFFDTALDQGGLGAHLTPAETAAFRARFVRRVVSVDAGASTMDSTLEVFKEEVPLVTEALVRCLRRAKVGFEPSMSSWAQDFTQRDFNNRLGRARMTPEKQAEVNAARMAAPISTLNLKSADENTVYDTREAIPECEVVIDHPHDQKNCGSCWIFSSMLAVDTAMCIKTRSAVHKFTGYLARLSRGYTCGCIRENDGACAGGWEYDAITWINNQVGIPTENCVTYDPSAFSCPTECNVESYYRSLEEDRFNPIRLSGPVLTQGLRDDPNKIILMKNDIMAQGIVTTGVCADSSWYTYVDVGPADVLDCGCDSWANHAIVCIGFGPTWWTIVNSWGPGWGNRGVARLSQDLLQDWTTLGELADPATWIKYPVPIKEYTQPSPDSSPAPGPTPTPR